MHAYVRACDKAPEAQLLSSFNGYLVGETAAPDQAASPAGASAGAAPSGGS